MTTKTELQNKIQELEAELVEFKSQLGSYEEITIENASVGDTLEDGSIVLKKENGLALLIAPRITEVECLWSKEFPKVFQALKKQGFNPSQWFVPTKEQLWLAYETIPNEFSPMGYWSSTEVGVVGTFDNATCAYNACLRPFPAKEHLEPACQDTPNEFSINYHWSSTEFNATNAHNACLQPFVSIITSTSKTSSNRVRAFRCVTY